MTFSVTTYNLTFHFLRPWLIQPSDLLKIDIEGEEFAAVTSFLESLEGNDLPVGQMMMELHLWKVEETAVFLLDWYVIFCTRGAISLGPQLLSLVLRRLYLANPELIYHAYHRFAKLEDMGMRLTWAEPNLYPVSWGLPGMEPRVMEVGLAVLNL
jgi:hypothetical protein